MLDLITPASWTDSPGSTQADQRVRLDLSPRQVTQRIIELQVGARAVADGSLSASDYARMVERYKPVHPFETLPVPSSREQMQDALGASKAAKVGVTHLALSGGEAIGVRLDIPSFQRRGVWVNCIHEAGSSRAVGRVIGYEAGCVLVTAEFQVHQGAALKVAAGAAKSPMAVIRGVYAPATMDEIVQQARRAMGDPDWIQVGMDPERHGYFYDRATMRPVLHAERVIQIGPLALARRCEMGDPSNYLY